eukprot:5632248-Pyramimonas_sp.AAC.1
MDICAGDIQATINKQLPPQPNALPSEPTRAEMLGKYTPTTSTTTPQKMRVKAPIAARLSPPPVPAAPKPPGGGVAISVDQPTAVPGSSLSPDFKQFLSDVVAIAISARAMALTAKMAA